jgi:F-type H+-transporting ATPase subunit delta
MAAASLSSGSRAYAQALLDAAAAQGGLEAAREAGQALGAVAAAWRADRRMRTFFLAANVREASKRQAYDRFRSTLPPLVASFISLLARKGRLEILPDVAEQVDLLLDERLGRVPVTLSTAVPMPADALARWSKIVFESTGKTPVMKNVVKPTLVGGAVIRIGDWLADGSVKKKLARLYDQIVEHGTRSTR